jgi:hypothetical protein
MRARSLSRTRKLAGVTVRKRHFLSHLYIKCRILPRQARDKHWENSKKVPVSLRRQALEGLPLRRRDSCGSACARKDRLHTARSPRGPALSGRPSSCVCGLRRCMVHNKRSRSGCCIALAFVPSLSREILLASFVGLLNRRGCVCVCVFGRDQATAVVSTLNMQVTVDAGGPGGRGPGCTCIGAYSIPGAKLQSQGTCCGNYKSNASEIQTGWSPRSKHSFER